ncbi:MAG: fasciclin domain-containing protein [Actinomycetota bacterium]
MTSERVVLRRYRRRIIGWGAGLALVVLVVGAVITSVRVENDLESRTEDRLSALGYDSLAASFVGQDGTIACAIPVAPGDAEIIEAEVSDVRGVRSVSIEEACVTAERTSAAALPTESVASPDVQVANDETAQDADLDESADTAPATTVDAPGTIGELIATDPQFSALRGAASLAGFDEIETAGPFTILAPTNEAFGALDPSVAGELNADPELMATVLAHHVIDGAVPAAELSSGPVEMIDGTSVTVSVADSGVVELTSGDVVAQVTTPDLTGSNGVLHVIDQVLLPADLELGFEEPDPLTAATYRSGRVTLDGVVADDAQRIGLVGVSTSRLDADNVSDQLQVDPASGITAGEAFGLAVLIDQLVVEFVEGVAAIEEDGLVLRGIVVDADSRDAVTAATADLSGLAIDVDVRPIATSEQAAAVAAAMNDLIIAQPIEFAPDSSAPLDSAAAVFDLLATEAKRYGGVVVTIEGHTDTAGDADTNEVLSQLRAEAVVAALIDRGVPSDDLVAVGFGDSDPIIVDGAEDAAASRRVSTAVELR